MSDIVAYLKYANLQMAAEALFEFNPNLNQDEVTPGSTAGYDTIPLAYLTSGNNRASRFPLGLAKDFAADWSVVETKSNTKTGFSGTLFKNTSTGELVLCFRSTEFIDDAVRDSKTNELEIKAAGWAFGQIADMESWYASLNSDPAKLQGKSFAVTGYSLGGHLATAFGILRREQGEDARIAGTYTFNGAGVGTFNPGTSLTQAIETFRSYRYEGAAGLFTSAPLVSLYNQLRSTICLDDAGMEVTSGMQSSSTDTGASKAAGTADDQVIACSAAEIPCECGLAIGFTRRAAGNHKSVDHHA